MQSPNGGYRGWDIESAHAGQDKLQSLDRMIRETHNLMLRREQSQTQRNAEWLQRVDGCDNAMSELAEQIKNATSFTEPQEHELGEDNVHEWVADSTTPAQSTKPESFKAPHAESEVNGHYNKKGSKGASLEVPEDALMATKSSNSALKAVPSQEAALERNPTLPLSALQRSVARILETLETPIALLIILNAVHIGAETHYVVSTCRAEHLARSEVNACDSHPAFKVISYFFTTIFSIELFMKIFLDRDRFLSRRNVDFRWNVFDSLIVSLSLIDVVFDIIGDAGPDLSQAKLVRVLRVVRIMRILRTIRFVKDLRVMLEGIMASGTAIIWALLILIGLQYMLAIVIMNIVKLDLESNAGSTDPLAVKNRILLLDPANGYTKLNDIIWHLFLGITGGADWADYVTPLTELGDGWQWVFRLLFMVYVSVVQLCVLNILTGVFVENANKIVGRDETNMMSQEMEERGAFNRALADIFDEICEEEDDNGKRTIGSEAFVEIVEDEHMQKQFMKLGVEVTSENAAQFFQMVDFDDDGQVSCEDFQSGIYRMHGPAKSIDMAQLIVNSQKTLSYTVALMQRLRPARHPKPSGSSNVKPKTMGGTSETVSRISQKMELDQKDRASRKSITRVSPNDGSASLGTRLPSS
jgi:hypothetical protein